MSDAPPGPFVLVVDDDPESGTSTMRWLRRGGFRTELCGSAEDALAATARSEPDVVCLDLDLGHFGANGLDALPVFRKRHPNTPVVMLTGDTRVESIVQAMHLGAFDYVPKMSVTDKLVVTVQNAVERRKQSGRATVAKPRFDGIVGHSASMQEVFRQLQKIASNDVTVLIHGESGTGKELIACAIHENSARASGPFVAVNCAAIPESLQDSELFGHERGAFTGADRLKPGRFEQADTGTLFLDEVAELSASLQAKLLRILQERKFERVGGTKTITSNFRLIVATHRDLNKMVKSGAFREDLYFRIAVLEVELPPLRDRVEDLRVLIDFLLEKIAAEQKRPAVAVTAEALKYLERYPWPGNVRELQNVLQRAAIIAERDEIHAEDLPRRLRETVSQLPAPASIPSLSPRLPSIPPSMAPGGANAMTLEELERWAIERTMTRTSGNIAEVTRRLGIGRTTLYRKLKQYGIK